MDWLWILTITIMMVYVYKFFSNKIYKNIITITLTMWNIIFIIIGIIQLIVTFV